MAQIVALPTNGRLPSSAPASPPPPRPPRWLVEWQIEEPLFIERTAAELALAAAEGAVAPADPRLVSVEITMMGELYSQQHGAPLDWGEAVRTHFYLEAFEDVPFDLVRLAFKRLRRSPLAFFPMPGQIRAHIEDDLAARNDTLRKARFALTRQCHPEPERPPPTEADKAAVAKLVAKAATALTMPKERGDASRPMTAADRQRVADELAGFRLLDENDPRVQVRLREMGEREAT